MDGGEVAGRDRFEYITSRFYLSCSREEQLGVRGVAKPVFCIAENSDESLPESGGDGVATASTQMGLVSVPESEENEFHTPPEEEEEAAPIAGSSQTQTTGEVPVRHGVVDLSRDSDSEMDWDAIPESFNRGIGAPSMEIRSGTFQGECSSVSEFKIVPVIDLGTGKVEERPWKKRTISEQNADEPMDVSGEVRGASRSPATSKPDPANDGKSKEVSRSSDKKKGRELSTWDILKIIASQCEDNREKCEPGSHLEVARGRGLM